MTRLRQQKISNIEVPDVEVEGYKEDAELLIVGFGGTYGHLHAAMDELRANGKKVALAHFKFINPLPKNTAALMKKYKKGSRAKYGTVCRISPYEGGRFRSLSVQPSERTALCCQ